MYLKKTLILSMLLFVAFINLSLAEQLTFKGKVVDIQGNPVSDAKIKFFNVELESFTHSSVIADIIETNSNANGEISFSVASDSSKYHYDFITVEKDGYALNSTQCDMQEIREFEFKLEKPQEFTGTIVDENNNPVPDAKVSILIIQFPDEEKVYSLSPDVAPHVLNTTTNAEGKFTFNKLPAQTKIDFLVQKKGRASVSTYKPGNIPNVPMSFSTDQKDIRIIQPLESRIEGKVVEKDSGKPAAGAKIIIRRAINKSVYGQNVITSGQDGTFSINQLEADSYILTYAIPREENNEWVAEPLNINLEVGQVVNDAKVELSKGGLFEVTIIDAVTGKALKGGSASVYDNKRMLQFFSNLSDDNGIAKIRLLQGTYQISYVAAEDYTGYMQREEIAVEEGRSKRMEIKLNPQPKLTGIVTDENNNPVENARIAILPLVVEETTSDSKGRFEIKWDLGGFFPEEINNNYVIVSHEKRNLVKVIEIGNGQQTINIKLQPGITISGKVVNSEGKGIAKAKIIPMLSMESGSSSWRISVKTDDSGNYQIENLPTNRKFRIQASAEGYGDKTLSFDTNNSVNNTVSIETIILPSANLSVSGQIVDSEGNPAAGASIQSSGGQPRVNTKADENGNFTLNGLCEGQVYIQVNAQKNDKRLTASARMEAGIEDIKIIVREGKSATQNITKETYEQIVERSEIVIAGVVVDENGSPVANVPVGVNCIRREQEDAPGKYRWTFSSYNDLTSTSDKQGRFVIALKEDASYDLTFSPNNYAAMLVYDVPSGKKDLKVVLQKGGTISGRLVRVDGDKKIPIPNAQLKLEQSDRSAYTHLGFDRDRSIQTDSEGRFEFEYIQTKIRPDGSMSKTEWEFVPRVWQLVYGGTSKTFAFYDSNAIDDFEFVIEPDLSSASQLKGNPLPGLDGIKIDFNKKETKDKNLLVCFFDIEQRPSRSCLIELSKKAAKLKEEGVEVIAIHASEVESDYLQSWLEENDINFPVGTIETNPNQIKSDWGVKALPWLIHSDKDHIVIEEGFSISELGEKL